MKSYRNKISLLVSCLLIMFVGMFFVNRGAVLAVEDEVVVDISDTFGVDTLSDSTGLGGEDVRVTIARIIRAVLTLLGIVALVIMLYGGFVYMTAAGAEDKIASAKKIMVNGAIGLAIILSAFTIVQFVLGRLQSATGFDSTGSGTNIRDARGRLIFDSCTANISSQFVVRSITPNTGAVSVGHENVQIRVIFSSGVDAGVSADKVFLVRLGERDVSGNYSFRFVDVARSVVEASYSGGDIVPAGTYGIDVREDLRSASGGALQVQTPCGSFPRSAGFVVVAGSGTDSVLPSVEMVTFNRMRYAGTIALPLGRTHVLRANITDNNGIGLVRMTMNSASFDNVVVFDGPLVRDSSFSPYTFTYPITFSTETKPLEIVDVSILVTDTDNMSYTYNFRFMVVGENCDPGTGGGDGPDCRQNEECTDNAQCLSGLCDLQTNTCVPLPIITDLSPWQTAKGSYVSVSGYNFGVSQGVIEFGVTSTGGEVTTWVPATVVSCGNSVAWTNRYAVVEVPSNDALLPHLSRSIVRLTRQYGATTISDTTNNNRGPIGGPRNDGLFTKDNTTSTPGICGVVVADGQPNAGQTIAVPGTPLRISGVNFGTNSTLGSISYGGVAGSASVWTNTGIDSSLPRNMRLGTVGVFVTVDRLTSNGFPFVVTNTLANTSPVIESITPSRLPAGNFITVKGWGFGESPGVVYLAPNISADCSVANVCQPLTSDLPLACGDTWSSRQVIVSVPTTISPADYMVVVRNSFNQYSVSVGTSMLTVLAPARRPNICSLTPRLGPAPLPTAHAGLNIVGTNFSNNPNIYFWTRGAVAGRFGTWLSTDTSQSVANRTTLTRNNGSDGVQVDIVRTHIPIQNGISMLSGPIVVSGSLGTPSTVSNEVNYTVSDCRTLGTDTIPAGMRCCSSGPDAGILRQNNQLCAGETREGGYMWRFATGLITPTPRVLERCATTTPALFPPPSPSPWSKWNKAGENTCINASITVSFSTGMVVGTPPRATNVIQVRRCGDGDVIDCTNGVDVTADLNFTYVDSAEGGTLSLAQPTGGLFAPRTWYRVEVSSALRSINTINRGGVITNRPIEVTRPCSPTTAYCFEFRTSTSNDRCQLDAVSMNPNNFTTKFLGPVLNPLFPRDRNIRLNHVLYGIGSRACTYISVEGMGWNWTTVGPLSTAATVVRSTGFDSRAITTALRDTVPESVVISATSPSTPVSASGNLLINLGPPTVKSFEPNCAEACINAALVATFNRQMNKDDYEDGFKLYRCPDAERCNDTNISLLTEITDIEVEDSDELSFRMNPDDGAGNLRSGTWYLAVFTSGIRSLKINPSAVGGELIPNDDLRLVPVSFRFRTKNDSTPCAPNRVSVSPSPFVATFIEERTRYNAYPHGAPDACSMKGQELNAWDFRYRWTSGNARIVTVSTLSSVRGSKQYCTGSCLPKGSSIASDAYTSATRPALCGNGLLDPGEDCDIGALGTDESAGVSCTLRCLRPGNPISTTTEPSRTIDVCGNGLVEPVAGEECDPADPVNGSLCGMKCLWKPVVTKFDPQNLSTPWCGDGEVSTGEDCEPGMNGSILGLSCSSSCVNLGTTLATRWCMSNPGSVIGGDPAWRSAECRTSRSVCGNGIVEFGEECEVIGGRVYAFNPTNNTRENPANPQSPVLTDALATSCTNRCQFTKICGTDVSSAYRCSLGDEGCDSDCTLLGSSVERYTVSSLCGDGLDSNGVAGTGEFAWCEFTSVEIAGRGSIQGQNPVQVATAVGEGTVVNGAQQTNVSSTVVRTSSGQEILPVTGGGDYILQCGYRDYLSALPGVAVDPVTVDTVRLDGIKNLYSGDDTAMDTRGSAHGEERGGVAYTDGRFGRAFLFDGVDDFMEIPSGRLQFGTNDFSVSLWFREGAVVNPTSQHPLFEIASPLGSPIRTIGMRTRHNAGANNVNFFVAGDQGTITIRPQGTTVIINDNRWHHVVGVRRGNNLELYIDGRMVANSTGGTIGAVNIERPFLIGRTGNASGAQFFPGLIDEFHIYDRALSLVEVQSLNISSPYAISISDPIGRTNNCPNPEHGVANNSCCYPRPIRIASYPVDGAGVGNAEPACRNTYISASFRGEIDEQSLDDNIMLVRGYESAPDGTRGGGTGACTGIGEVELTDVISGTIARADYSDFGNVKSDSMFRRIWRAVKSFFARIFGGEVLASAVQTPNITVWCTSGIDLSTDIAKHRLLSEAGESVVASTTVVININSLLEPNTTYAILLRGGTDGIEDARGVGIGSPDISGALDDSFIFRTRPTDAICTVASIETSPDARLYTRPADDYDFLSIAKTVDGALIARIPGVYNWSWTWLPQGNPLFTISSADRAVATVTSTNIEGKLTASTNLTVTEAPSDRSLEGSSFSDTIALRSMFCENPWPVASSYPFNDGPDNLDATDAQGVFTGQSIPATLVGGSSVYFNFSTGYCADAGKGNDRTDDLPYLRPVIVPPTGTNTIGLLKRVLFFNNLNTDAIGIQIFSNLDVKTPREWFNQDASLGSTENFQDITVDGYEAMTDGNSIYVAALNRVQVGTVTNIYSNIYQFSINPDATTETRDVFTKLLRTLEFNTNLTDISYCSNNGDITRASTETIQICRNDFDCMNVSGTPMLGTAGVCANERTKFVRDWDRLRDVKDVQIGLAGYENNRGSAPTFDVGSYIPARTISKWPSWARLSSDIGGVSSDPLNRWTRCGICEVSGTGCAANLDCAGGAIDTCRLLDASTCWDDRSSSYVCPRAESVNAYVYNPATREYTYHVPFEILSLSSPFVTGYLPDSDRISSAPSCSVPLSVISMSSTRCGDGVVNPVTEQCDPPGSVTRSSRGRVVSTRGTCAYSPDRSAISCTGDDECRTTRFSVDLSPVVNPIVERVSTTKVCMFSGDLVYHGQDPLQSFTSVPGIIVPQICTDDSDCVGTLPAKLNNNNRLYRLSNREGGIVGLTSGMLARTDDISCGSLDRARFFERGGSVACTGVAYTEMSCPSGEFANATCSNSCTLTSGICRVSNTCGNGRVEGVERCDDGALNGTYGSCNSNCTGRFGDARCGNGIVDSDSDGNRLELCDMAPLGYTRAICKRNSCETDPNSFSGNQISNYTNLFRVGSTGNDIYLVAKVDDQNSNLIKVNESTPTVVQVENVGTNNIGSLFVLDSDNKWASSGGAFLRFDTVSRAWMRVVTGQGGGINDIFFVDRNLGFVVQTNRVLRSRDGGRTWSSVAIIRDGNLEGFALTGVFFVDDKTGFVFGGSGVLYRSTDGGTSWTQIPSGTNGEIYDVHFVDQDFGWLSTEANNGVSGIYYTTNGGRTWTRSTIPTLSLSGVYRYEAIKFANRQVGFAVVNGNSASVILKSVDGGRSWTVSENYSGAELGDISLISADAVRFVGKIRVGGVDRAFIVVYKTDPYCTSNFESCVADVDDCRSGDTCVSLPNYSYHPLIENTCSYDCQSRASYCGDGVLNSTYESCDDGNRVNGDGCENRCYRTPTRPIAVAIASDSACGNGFVDPGEACDLGGQNGVSCTPGYGQSCNYCNSACSAVITVQPMNFCGNSRVDSPPEVCEVDTRGKTITSTGYILMPTPLNPLNLMVGTTTCATGCLALSDDTMECGLKSTSAGGAVPNIAIINPINPTDSSIPDRARVMTGWVNRMVVGLYATNHISSINPRRAQFGSQVVTETLSFPFMKSRMADQLELFNRFDVDPSIFGLESRDKCDGVYKIRFTRDDQVVRPLVGSDLLAVVLPPGISRTTHGSEFTPGDYFDYPVRGEGLEIRNTIVASPAVATGTIRAVIRWNSRELGDGSTAFLGNIGTTSDNQNFLYPVGDRNILCDGLSIGDNNDERNMMYPAFARDGNACATYGSIGAQFHPFGISPGGVGVQSVTINTASLVPGNTYAFFVKGLSGRGGNISMYDQRNSTLEVGIYEAHRDQLKYSLYNPTKKHLITTAAGSSSNPLALYWHVFNIRRVGDSYEIIPVDQIETGYQDILANLNLAGREEIVQSGQILTPTLPPCGSDPWSCGTTFGVCDPLSRTRTRIPSCSLVPACTPLSTTPPAPNTEACTPLCPTTVRDAWDCAGTIMSGCVSDGSGVLVRNRVQSATNSTPKLCTRVYAAGSCNNSDGTLGSYPAAPSNSEACPATECNSVVGGMFLGGICYEANRPIGAGCLPVGNAVCADRLWCDASNTCQLRCRIGALDQCNATECATISGHSWLSPNCVPDGSIVVRSGERCGGPAIVCAAGTSCVGGTCQTVCTAGNIGRCTNQSACENANGAWTGSSCVPPGSGKNGEACASANTCEAGYVCDGDVCVSACSMGTISACLTRQSCEAQNSAWRGDTAPIPPDRCVLPGTVVVGGACVSANACVQSLRCVNGVCVCSLQNLALCDTGQPADPVSCRDAGAIWVSTRPAGDRCVAPGSLLLGSLCLNNSTLNPCRNTTCQINSRTQESRCAGVCEFEYISSCASQSTCESQGGAWRGDTAPTPPARCVAPRTVVAGGACASANACVTGLSCASDAGNTCQQSCRPTNPAGCTTSGLCGQLGGGFSWVNISNTCSPVNQLPLNASCDRESTIQCSIDLGCSSIDARCVPAMDLAVQNARYDANTQSILYTVCNRGNIATPEFSTQLPIASRARDTGILSVQNSNDLYITANIYSTPILPNTCVPISFSLQSYNSSSFRGMIFTDFRITINSGRIITETNYTNNLSPNVPISPPFVVTAQ